MESNFRLEKKIKVQKFHPPLWNNSVLPTKTGGFLLIFTVTTIILLRFYRQLNIGVMAS